MGKSKFIIGEKVRYKGKNGEGMIFTIGSVRYDAADRRNVYTLNEWPSTCFVYSNQLEKLCTSKTDDSVVVAKKITIGKRIL